MAMISKKQSTVTNPLLANSKYTLHDHHNPLLIFSAHSTPSPRPTEVLHPRRRHPVRHRRLLELRLPCSRPPWGFHHRPSSIAAACASPHHHQNPHSHTLPPAPFTRSNPLHRPPPRSLYPHHQPSPLLHHPLLKISSSPPPNSPNVGPNREIRGRPRSRLVVAVRLHPSPPVDVHRSAACSLRRRHLYQTTAPPSPSPTPTRLHRAPQPNPPPPQSSPSLPEAHRHLQLRPPPPTSPESATKFHRAQPT